jgi:hypothetical protein
LVDANTATLFLRSKNHDLLLRTADAGLCCFHGRFGCIFTRSHLVIVENGDHIAGSHNVALAEVDLANASGSLGGNRCFVTCDPSRGNHKVPSPLLCGPANKDVPDQEGGGRNDERD